MGGSIVFLAVATALGAVPFLITYLAARGTERENRASAKALPSIGSARTLFRLLVVVLCSVLSVYGFFIGAILALAAISLASGRSLLALIFPYALLAHAIMCIAWIGNHRLSRFWVITGTTAVVGSFLLFSSPLALMGSGYPGFSAGMLMLELVFVLPSLCLAIHLAVFHLRSE
jgi:hypothetical protein